MSVFCALAVRDAAIHRPHDYTALLLASVVTHTNSPAPSLSQAGQGFAAHRHQQFAIARLHRQREFRQEMRVAAYHPSRKSLKSTPSAVRGEAVGSAFAVCFCFSLLLLPLRDLGREDFLLSMRLWTLWTLRTADDLTWRDGDVRLRQDKEKATREDEWLNVGDHQPERKPHAQE